MVADFASEYGIRLHSPDFLAWREFHALLIGLLSSDTRLYRRFAPQPES